MAECSRVEYRKRLYIWKLCAHRHHIDDDMSCYDARVRFGLVLNNESTVYTLNDAAGFGASSYYSGACDYSDDQDAPWSVGAGFAAGGNLYQRAGTIWVR